MRISDWSSDVCSSDLLLFPVLTSALPDPAIRTELVKTLGGQPKWAAGFIHHAARSEVDPAASAAFFRALQARRVPVPDAAGVAVINRLLAAQLFDDAWAYYAAAHQIGSASCRERVCQDV